MAYKRVYDVTDIRVSEMGDGRFLLEADGRVSSGGWREPSLFSTSAGIMSEDGTLEFEFVAIPSGSGTFTTQSFEDVTAHTFFGGEGTDLTGLRRVRVVASKNAKGMPFTG